MKIAWLPSNQTDNATAIPGVTESDLQLPIARAAQQALSATGIESRVFHIPHVATSSGYPRFPQLHEMCRQAAAWGPDVVILNHSDACGSQPAGLLTLADSGIKGNAEYIAWTKAYHAALGPAMGRPLKLWTLDSAYVGFRYGFYSYLANNGFHGWPLIVELANHMSRADAEWLRDNPGPIGRALAAALMQTLGLEGDDMYTDEDRKLLEDLNRDHAAQSFRESIALAVLCQDWDGADALMAEAKRAGFDIKGYRRPDPR